MLNRFDQQKRFQFTILSLTLIAASLTLLLSGTAFFQRFELVTLDTFFKLRPSPPQPSSEIVVVEVNNDNIRAVGRWPWDRDYLVRINEALLAFGAKDIVYDFLITDKTEDRQGDLALQKSIRDTGNVYLPVFVVGFQGKIVEVVEPIGRLSEYARGTGFVNIHPDIDGSMRRLPLFYYQNGRYYQSLALRVAADHLGQDVMHLSSGQILLGGSGRQTLIPLDGNALLLNWYGPWEDSFPRYDFLSVLEAHEALKSGKLPDFDMRAFKDKICLVALSARGLYDIKPVPLDIMYPGVGIIATAVSNILNRDFIFYLPHWFNILFIYLIALIPAFLVQIKRPFKEVLFLLAAVVVFGCLFFLFQHGFIMTLFAPFLALLISHLLILTYSHISAEALSRQLTVYEEQTRRLKASNKSLSDSLQQMANQQKNLQHINQELDQFVRTVSHDMRSPLMCLIGYADMLQRTIQDHMEDQDREIVEGIFVSVENLNEMMNALLQTTKQERMENPYEPVNCSDLIAMIRRRLAFMIADKKVRFDVQPDLPVIICDRIKMGEVFHNLIINAIKFSFHQPQGPLITIRYQALEHYHQFMVKDNGIGVDPQYHQIIFEDFQRCGPDDKEGHGIGLSIVRQVIAGHGGKVWVKSQLGQGAAFFFTIPKGLKG